MTGTSFREGFPDPGCEGAAHHRGEDEDPNDLEGLSTGEDGRTDGTGRVHGGTRQVDADQVDEDQGQTDGQAGQVARAFLRVGRTQDDEDEEERGDALDKERASDTACIGDAIGAETAGKVRSRNHFRDEEEHRTGDDAADELTDFLVNGNITNSVNFPTISLGKATKPMRICLIHKNIPNVISRITTVLGNSDANISDMVSKSRGDYAYALFDMDSKLDEATLETLKKTEGVIRIHVIEQE